MDVAQENFRPGGRRSSHRRLSPLWKAAATALCLLFVPALSAQTAEQPVIYPRGSAPADAPARTESRGPAPTTLLAFALLAGAGGWWLWLKRRGGVRAGLAGNAKLSIAESKSLGSRQYLVVADYDGKKFLLGVCPGSIELLTPLDGEKAKDVS